MPVAKLLDLTGEQEQFLARACAFIGTQPPQDELNKLLTLAAMLLPAPVAELLEKCAAAAARRCADDPLTRRLH